MRNTLFCLSILFCFAWTSCAPGRKLAEIATERDTIVEVRNRVVTDTVVLAGEYIEDQDTFRCPPGLVVDSLVFVREMVYVPGKKVVVNVPVHDTVRTVIRQPAPAEIIFAKGRTWPERLAWIAAVLALLLGWWKHWKEDQKATPSGVANT